MFQNWDRSNLECVQVLMGHTGSVLCLQYDENIIISGSSDSTVRSVVHALVCVCKCVYMCVCVLVCACVRAGLQYDENIIISGSSDSTVRSVVHALVCTCVYIRMYMCVCVYVCVCVCIVIYNMMRMSAITGLMKVMRLRQHNRYIELLLGAVPGGSIVNDSIKMVIGCGILTWKGLIYVAPR